MSGDIIVHSLSILLLCIITGEYWLDPNGGNTNDKIKVICNFNADTVETCVKPIAQFDIVKMEEFKSNEFTQHKWLARETENAKVSVFFYKQLLAIVTEDTAFDITFC